MMVVDYQLVGAAAGAYLALFAYKWALGRRAEAFYELENLADALAGVLILQLILTATEAIVAAINGILHLPSPASPSPEPSTLQEAALSASESLRRLAETAKNWILAYEGLRALFAAAPLTYYYSDVLEAAGGWAVNLLGLEAISFLTLSAYARAFAYVAPWLAAVGAALFPIPRTRWIAATILSSYLATGIAVAYCGAFAAATNPLAPPPNLPHATGLEAVIPIANLVAAVAQALLDTMAKCAVALGLSTLAGYGLASIFHSFHVPLVKMR